MGTPGHMAHPFDVEDIQTGEDLLVYINDIVTKLGTGEIAGSVKWDGINTSIKLITNDDGEKEFRMDRGTSEIASVVGFDAEAAFNKWGQNHGMPRAIANVLAIFNQSIPHIKKELRTLGLWDDPTRYFNTEYIEGTSNVQEYDDNILAIHGINQFYEKKAQAWRIRNGTSMDRPGLPRPNDSNGKPIKAGGIEVPYDHTALADLIRKVQPTAVEHGFQVFGDVPVEFDPEMELDIEKVLDIPIEIQIAQGNIKSASLREWLQMVKHPKDKMITKVLRDKDGKEAGEKKVGALSKDVYLAVLRSAKEGGIPLNVYLKDPLDIDDAINGGIFYHATRLLGQAVKENLTSAAGNLGRHEGVVLRGLEDFLVKLTGDFIVQGLASTHGDHVSENISKHFTITVSQDRSITKHIQEWLTEAAAVNHAYQKLPEMVYRDILAGTPIVDIVPQENAEKAIYNAVMGYVDRVLKEQDDDFPTDNDWYEWRHYADQDLGMPLDDEDEDPVVDSDYPKTIAIVPGAFKPPHKGHLAMVEEYANMADEVIVLISKPLNNNRSLPTGEVITAGDSSEIWNILAQKLGNVTIGVFNDREMRSPISAAYAIAGAPEERAAAAGNVEPSITPIPAGSEIILGASTKDGDWKRWTGAEKYIGGGPRGDLKLISPEATAVAPEEYSSEYMNLLAAEAEKKSDLYLNMPSVKAGKDPKQFHAGDFRYILVESTKNDVARALLPDFVGEENVVDVLKVFGLASDLEETSMAGAVAGAGGTLTGVAGNRSGKGDDDEEDIVKRSENIDLSIVDEVIRLIMEKGIAR